MADRKRASKKNSSSGGRSSTKSSRGGNSADSLVASGGRKKPATPQIWMCKVDGLRNFMGQDRVKGDTVMVIPGTLDAGTQTELEKYFELTETISTTVTSEPIEAPKEESELEGETSDA